MVRIPKVEFLQQVKYCQFCLFNLFSLIFGFALSSLPSFSISPLTHFLRNILLTSTSWKATWLSTVKCSPSACSKHQHNKVTITTTADFEPLVYPSLIIEPRNETSEPYVSHPPPLPPLHSSTPQPSHPLHPLSASWLSLLAGPKSTILCSISNGVRDPDSRWMIAYQCVKTIPLIQIDGNTIGANACQQWLILGWCGILSVKGIMCPLYTEGDKGNWLLPLTLPPSLQSMIKSISKKFFTAHL